MSAGVGEQAISPLIYGMGLNNANLNMHPPELFVPPPPHLSNFRLGGDDWSTFNWTNNDCNSGVNWFFANTSELLLPKDPTYVGAAVKERVLESFAQSASVVVTVPTLGYVAADGILTDVRQSTDYFHTRLKPSVARKGAAFGPGDPNAPTVYEDEFVFWLEGQFPTAHDAGKPNLLYQLDNEPDLWAETQAASHPAKATYAEVFQKSNEYADAIKAVAPKALVLGASLSGWEGFVNLGGAPDAAAYAAGGDFIDNFLAQTKGHVDILDVRWYEDVNVTTAGGGTIEMDMSQITKSEFSDPASQAVRVQLPRSLWDQSYVENSSITQWQTGGKPITLIPRIKSKINALSPDVKLSITEYYYGGGEDISGAIAQADALGIFGTQGVYLASLWPNNYAHPQKFLYAACNMFRNYDGASASFGDTSIPATTSDVEKSSIYASTDAGSRNRVVLVALNKTTGALTTDIHVTFDVTKTFTRAEIYELTASASSSLPTRKADVAITTSGGATSFSITMPAMSVTTIALSQ